MVRINSKLIFEYAKWNEITFQNKCISNICRKVLSKYPFLSQNNK